MNTSLISTQLYYMTTNNKLAQFSTEYRIVTSDKICFSCLKWILFISLILLHPLISFANIQQSSTTLYIVRHAEAELTTDGELILNEIGQQRAEDLAKALQTKNIHAIYASHSSCDKETAKKLAKNKRLFINTYDDENIISFQQRILTQRKGQNVLIVGNLETITTLLKSLSDSFSTSNVNQQQFNILFEVQIAADNSAFITQLQYSQLETIIGPPANNTLTNTSIQPEQEKKSIEWANEQKLNTFPVSIPNTDNPTSFNTDTEREISPSFNEGKSNEQTIMPSTTTEKNSLPSLLPSSNLTKKGIALLGYDLVAYFKNNKASKGQEKFATKYRDVTFYFTNRKNLHTFLENPESYLPKYGGWCALGMSIEGVKDGYTADKYAVDPENFKIIDGELYLFYKTLDYDALLKWNAEPDEAACIERADKYWEELNKE